MALIAVRVEHYYEYQEPGQIGKSHKSLKELGYPDDVPINVTENQFHIEGFNRRGILEHLPEVGQIIQLGKYKDFPVYYRIEKIED